MKRRRRAGLHELPEGSPAAFVAIDLLSIDDQSLLDVPLLERKRLLEAAIGEDELVRRTMMVRPPVEAWLGQWKALVGLPSQDNPATPAPGANERLVIQPSRPVRVHSVVTGDTTAIDLAE